MITRLLAMAFCAGLGAMPRAGVASEAPLRLSTLAEVQPDHPAAQLLRRAYGRIGKRVEIVYLPPERALVEAAAGKHIDGELLRSREVGDAIPTLLRVDVPLQRVHAGVFLGAGQAPVRRYADLGNRRVDAVNGFRYLAGRLAPYNVTWVGSMEQALRRVAMGRADAAILPAQEAEQLRVRLQIEGVSLQEQPLETVEIFHFVHQKHQTLVPALEAALHEELAAAKKRP